VMLLSAVFMLRGRSKIDSAVPRNTPIPFYLIALKGIVVGLLAGVVGVGGGFLIVPALVLLGHVPVKQAIGTSLMVIAMNSAAGFTGYLGQVELPWEFLATFTAVAVAGILTGSFAARRIHPAVLQRAFAVFLLFMGTFILYQNRAVVRGLLPGHAHAEVRIKH
ncbi:MAG TPA: sulfite exporter TauE/SafE family protein, partial [Longimicrobiales bacterium]|nr:sulfite exporter TauE/SafE family protein [Longimicrobiales bacterium]